MELIAYVFHQGTDMPLVNAPRTRPWMDSTNQHFANRCLPLLIANQAGWFILNSHPFQVTWDGGDGIGSLSVEYTGVAPHYPAKSHFGYGILTWNLPYLFRTPGGYNLLVRGPANCPKDGIAPLEGLIETDWASATFTMNWKCTRAHMPITFEKGEPICMLVPQKRGELETFLPQVQPISSDVQTAKEYQQWCESRTTFLQELPIAGTDAYARGWQKDYFKGIAPDGKHVAGHQTKLVLREFMQEAS